MAFEDVSCFDSVTGLPRLGEKITGALVPAQRVAIRLLSDPGSIPGDPDAGLGLARMRNADFTPDDVTRLQVQAQGEAAREQGVIRCRVTATLATRDLALMVELLTSEGAANVSLQIDAAGARAFFS